MVAPRRRTSLATKLLNMILRMDDLPEPLLPISKTFCFWSFGFDDSMLAIVPRVDSARSCAWVEGVKKSLLLAQRAKLV